MDELNEVFDRGVEMHCHRYLVDNLGSVGAQYGGSKHLICFGVRDHLDKPAGIVAGAGAMHDLPRHARAPPLMTLRN